MVSFSDTDWSPELVELCLRYRRRLEQLCLWGIGSTDWPPQMGAASLDANYPRHMNIMTTRIDFERAWKSLSRKERAVLDLYYLQEKTLREIAPIMKYSFQHISRLVEKARKRIEVFLGSDVTNGVQ